jgi:hypothetical protein
MIAVGFMTYPAYEIVIAGKVGADDTEEMVRAIRQQYLPNTVVLFRPPGDVSDIVNIAPFTKNLKAIGDRAAAYVCANFTCQSPTTDVDDMLKLLNVQKPRVIR